MTAHIERVIFQVRRIYWGKVLITCSMEFERHRSRNQLKIFKKTFLNICLSKDSLKVWIQLSDMISFNINRKTASLTFLEKYFLAQLNIYSFKPNASNDKLFAINHNIFRDFDIIFAISHSNISSWVKITPKSSILSTVICTGLFLVYLYNWLQNLVGFKQVVVILKFNLTKQSLNYLH